MIVLIKLLLAHLIGDFLLQPNQWVKAKEIKKLKAYQLYLHTVIHFALVMLLIGDIGFVWWGLLLVTSHFITDVTKLYAQNDKTKRIWFFVDQFIHLVFILLVWMWSQNIPFALPLINKDYYILLITFIYALSQPVSVVIRSIISKWSPEPIAEGSQSLEKAGNFIGVLERLLVFTFVVTNNFEAIGFLLAAKSIFRFGDLKESRERKLTEYVLIGTLLSFGIALLAGILFQKLIIV